MNEQLVKKIEVYRNSNGTSKWDDKSISRECKRLTTKLGLEKSIEPKEYRMLRYIGEGLKVGEKVDLSAAARKAGYPEWKVKQPETMILRDIPNVLFNELVGINRNEIEMELVKVMKQDENLAAKNKAIEMGLRVTGMMEPEKTNQININNGGITVAD